MKKHSNNKNLHLSDCNQLDLVDFLSRLGFQPTKIRRQDYWYLSPLRRERTASFKVNRNINCWYDHGIGEGGRLIDFGLKYFACTLPELMTWIQSESIAFIPAEVNQVDVVEVPQKLLIKSVGKLKSASLLKYIRQRGIDLEIAQEHCRQVSFTFGRDMYSGIGFQNDADGYEIRQPFYKYSSAPKDLSTFDLGFSQVAIFEGFMDFLSFLSFQKDQGIETNHVVLNGIGLFEKARPFIEKHEHCHLYLDRDATGLKVNSYALGLSRKYEDKSQLYKGFKDMNEWWMMREDAPKLYQKLSLKI